MNMQEGNTVLQITEDQPVILFDRETGCYVEEYFREALALERKRSERSGRPFTLVLADIGGVPPDDEWRRTAAKTVQALSRVTRDTDVKGWYHYGSVLGVIFTEARELDEDAMWRKMLRSLAENLTPTQAGHVKLSFHCFAIDRTAPGCPEHLVFYPDIAPRRRAVKAAQAVKRLMDVAGSLCGIVLLSPVFLVVALLVKLTSPGPVLFRQKRVGQYGKPFLFMKFRSMYVDNDEAAHKKYVFDHIAGKTGEAGSGTTFKLTDDPRITPLGGILRKSSLDELPQFFNVLFGDMSLVGPRPPIPYEVEKYDIWHRRRIMEIKPGITGLWQVKGRSSTTFDEMVRLDLQYAREWSLWLDIGIILKTPYVVIRGKGAY